MEVKCTRCKQTIPVGSVAWLVETEDSLEHPFCEQCHKETFLPSKGRKVIVEDNND